MVKMQKYLEFGERGALLFDIDRPSGVSNGFGTFNWASMKFAKRSLDKLFQVWTRTPWDPQLPGHSGSERAVAFDLLPLSSSQPLTPRLEYKPRMLSGRLHGTPLRRGWLDPAEAMRRLQVSNPPRIT